MPISCGPSYRIIRGKGKGNAHHRHERKQKQQPLSDSNRASSSLSFFSTASTSSNRASSSLSFLSAASTVARAGLSASCAFKSSETFNSIINDHPSLSFKGICRRGGPSESPGIWVPPEELQRLPVPEGYTILFPIELTAKDYFRRIFDIVGMCIQGFVLRMKVKYRDAIGHIGSKQEQYDFTKMCDLYYLMKHIMDPTSAPVYARGSYMLRDGSQPFHLFLHNRC
jgi:hypothetical protein